jgi:peptidoglycan/LPS O-acetylase OafA/YrhL
MRSDTIRLVFTYITALVVIVGGLYIIYETRLDPPEADVQGMRLLLAGFVGSALAFVFGRESSSASAFQSERAYAAGLAAPTIPLAVNQALTGSLSTGTSGTAPEEP